MDEATQALLEMLDDDYVPATPPQVVCRQGNRIVTADGTQLFKRENRDIFDGDPNDVPGPSRAARWNGVCQFLPMPWAETAKRRVAHMTGVQAVCLSCHKHLIYGRYADGIVALAHASDHDRYEVGHQIVVLDANGQVIVRNDYTPLAPCAR